MDPTTLIAPTFFPNVVTSPNDPPVYCVREQLADGTTSVQYLHKGRNLVGSNPFLCRVYVASAHAVHAIIDVGEDGMVLVRDPFGHGVRQLFS
ncbi:MAG: hypothetical protein J3Q66DRAFT_404663 [Benniella sp.]|nr:MAG: hypothetical protein J3Q66DRAFT_404663 [Benniella sp.]